MQMTVEQLETALGEAREMISRIESSNDGSYFVDVSFGNCLSVRVNNDTVRAWMKTREAELLFEIKDARDRAQRILDSAAPPRQYVVMPHKFGHTFTDRKEAEQAAVDRAMATGEHQAVLRLEISATYDCKRE